MNNNPNKECRRCGNCCHVDMIAYVTESDIRRWELERRFDILSRIQENEIIWSGDTIVSTGGKRLKSCIYLNCDGKTFFCDIYETRPQVCRDFHPGSSEFCSLHSESSIKK